MAFQVIIPKKVEKQIKSLPQVYINPVRNCLKSLKESPYQGKKLKDELKNKYSLRVGVYRIIYQIFKKELIILIVDISHRKEVYRRK